MVDIERVRSLVKYIPSDLKLFGREHALATMVLTDILGIEWTNRRFFNVTNNPNFLQERVPIILEGTLDSHFDRVVNLAEMLFNLQGVSGYESVVKRLHTGDIESTFAELETGAVLYRHRIQFRFVAEVGQRGRDYDLEVWLKDGYTVAAETKARLRTSDISSRSIYKRLNAGRAQLPHDRPSFLFLRVAPNLLLHNPETMAEINEAIRKLFAGTKRVAAVKLHTIQTIYDRAVTMHKALLTKEYYNRKCTWLRSDEYVLFDCAPMLEHEWISMRGILGRPEFYVTSPLV